MDIATAKAAGQIAARIEERQQKRIAVDLAIAEGWKVTDLVARNDATGDQRSLIVGALSAETSAQGLAFVKSLYDAEITALEAQLAALGA